MENNVWLRWRSWTWSICIMIYVFIWSVSLHSSVLSDAAYDGWSTWFVQCVCYAKCDKTVLVYKWMSKAHLVQVVHIQNYFFRFYYETYEVLAGYEIESQFCCDWLYNLASNNWKKRQTTALCCNQKKNNKLPEQVKRTGASRALSDDLHQYGQALSHPYVSD